jgi:hypothetical protein
MERKMTVVDGRSGISGLHVGSARVLWVTATIGRNRSDGVPGFGLMYRGFRALLMKVANLAKVPVYPYLSLATFAGLALASSLIC